jgi:hypothetical protein
MKALYTGMIPHNTGPLHWERRLEKELQNFSMRRRLMSKNPSTIVQVRVICTGGLAE